MLPVFCRDCFSVFSILETGEEVTRLKEQLNALQRQDEQVYNGRKNSGADRDQKELQLQNEVSAMKEMLGTLTEQKLNFTMEVSIDANVNLIYIIKVVKAYCVMPMCLPPTVFTHLTDFYDIWYDHHTTCMRDWGSRGRKYANVVLGCDTIFSPEVGDSMFPQNAGIYLQPRRTTLTSYHIPTFVHLNFLPYVIEQNKRII